jgi:hypothetical protein
METVSGDKKIVARTQIAFAFALNPYTSRPGDDQDPLVLLLIIGFIGRSKLAGGDDPLDPDPLS